MRDRLTPLPSGIQVNLTGCDSLRKPRLLPRYRGKVGVLSKKRGKCFEVVVPGSYPVGYKTLVVDRAEIQPCKNPLPKDIKL